MDQGEFDEEYIFLQWLVSGRKPLWRGQIRIISK